MKLNQKEQKLVAALLRMAAEVYSNHGCNDLDDELFEDWTDEEKTKMCRDFHEWNGDPESYEDGDEICQDWLLMDWMAQKLDPQ